MSTPEIRCFFPFIGLGVGALGFQQGSARVGQLQARFRCIGGVDVDPGAVANAQRLLGAPVSVLDMFSREQYTAFHGRPPPDDWREATPADIRRAAGYERPHIVFTSPPCKGFSGLTSETKSRSPKYQALNELALRGIWLTLEAFADDPPEFWLMENVPRIASRGRHLLEQIKGLLFAYGYAVAETTHDCGELGGLAQSRKRFLLVGRHMEKVPNFLYEPVRRPLRAVGEVLSRLPLPDDPGVGPMHRLPQLSWKTWLRLAFVEAGKDWRNLNRLAVVDGYLRDYALAVAGFGGYLGVNRWDSPMGAVAGESLPTNGKFGIADPRWDAGRYDCGQYGVMRYTDTSGTVIGVKSPGQGRFAVADPRVQDGPAGAHFGNIYKVVRWGEPGPTITGSGRPSSGATAIADVRCAWSPAAHRNKMRVSGWDQPAPTVIGGGKGVQGGRLSVTDPRPGLARTRGSDYLTAGHYGVTPWSEPAYAVTGSLGHDNGRGSVADPRLPEPDERLRCLIVAEDGTWHRPFTTLECAALQSIFDPEQYAAFELRGSSDQQLREWIGNAVPRDAAAAIAGVFGHALLLAWSGETHIVSDTPVWVQPVIAAIQCGTSIEPGSQPCNLVSSNSMPRRARCLRKQKNTPSLPSPHAGSSGPLSSCAMVGASNTRERWRRPPRAAWAALRIGGCPR